MPDAPKRLQLRALGMIVFLLVICSLLGGCDREYSSVGKTRIELWTLALRPRFDAYMSGVIAEFEKQNPSIDVVWVDVPFDAIQRKFLAAAAAGRAPDVINLSDGFYSRFVALGGVADISGLLPGDADQTYFNGAMSICRMNGRVYALPWYLATSITFANAQLLAEGGLTPEQLGGDWPTVRRQAVEYHQRTGKFLFCPMLGQESRLPLWMLQSGLSPFRRKADGAGLESNLTDPKIVRFVQDWVDLYRSGAVPTEAAVGGHGPMIDLYQNGRTAMLITGPNFLERIRDAAPDVYKNTQIRPAVRGELGKFEIATMLLSVSSQSKHPRESAALAWFITSSANQLAFAKIVNILPSTPESLADPHFASPSTWAAATLPSSRGAGWAQPTTTQTEDPKLAYARALSAKCLNDATSFIPPIPAWPELTTSFQEHIKSALLDGADVGETLAKISREWNGILDSHPPAAMPVFP